jgi:hypothetical protein
MSWLSVEDDLRPECITSGISYGKFQNLLDAGKSKASLKLGRVEYFSDVV